MDIVLLGEDTGIYSYISIFDINIQYSLFRIYGGKRVKDDKYKTKWGGKS